VTKSLSPFRKSHTTRSIERKRKWAVEARKPDLYRDGSLSSFDYSGAAKSARTAALVWPRDPESVEPG